MQKSNEYKYKVKLLVPKHKKPITRHLHQMFSSVEDIKEYILKELCNEFPRAATVDVGYYDGRQSSKIWLVSKEDLQHMYSSVCKHGEIAFVG